jgi:hypothetical protein
MRKILFVLLAMAVPLFATYGVTLYAADDTYTDPNGGNFGASHEIWVANFSASGHFERGCLRFDLSPYAGETVVSATVHLYHFFSCPSGTPCMIDFHAVTQAWNEDTWSGGHLDHGSTVYQTQSFSKDTTGWNEIDLTYLFQAWLDGGEPNNYGFVMHSRSGSKFAKFHSKEYGDSWRPRVELVLSSSEIEESSFGQIKAMF